MASPSPTAEDRPPRAAERSDTRDRLDRSRSPNRDKSRKSKGGFRWKDKRRDDPEDERDRGGRLERGYNDRLKEERHRNDRHRDDRYSDDRRRDSRDDRYRQDRYRGDGDSYRSRDDRRRDEKDSLSRGPRRGRSDSPESGRRREGDRDRDRDRERDRVDDGASRLESKDKKERKEKKERRQKFAPPQEAMIVVHVNDRLGTKAAIACLPSDPIKVFKMQVAAQIGREPHEILLKRQGERPFKDQLTLEDYGIGNGVQLDLEVDTGD